MLPPAPGLFSTTTLWPQASVSFCAISAPDDVERPARRERHDQLHRLGRVTPGRAGRARRARPAATRPRRARSDGGERRDRDGAMRLGQSRASDHGAVASGCDCGRAMRSCRVARADGIVATDWPRGRAVCRAACVGRAHNRSPFERPLELPASIRTDEQSRRRHRRRARRRRRRRRRLLVRHAARRRRRVRATPRRAPSRGGAGRRRAVRRGRPGAGGRSRRSRSSTASLPQIDHGGRQPALRRVGDAAARGRRPHQRDHVPGRPARREGRDAGAARSRDQRGRGPAGARQPDARRSASTIAPSTSPAATSSRARRRTRPRTTYKVAEAAVALAEAKLAKTEIRAPFSGIIGLRSVSVGDYVKEGADIVNLESIDPLKVDFRVPETYLRQVQVGQTLQVTLDALPGKTYDGKVFARQSAGRRRGPRDRDPRAGAQPGHGAAPGMFARVRLITRDERGRAGGARAGAGAAGQRAVRVPVVDGKASRAKVEIGPAPRRQGRDRAAASTAGDIVVTAGQLKLRDGVPVRSRRRRRCRRRPRPRRRPRIAAPPATPATRAARRRPTCAGPADAILTARIRR